MDSCGEVTLSHTSTPQGENSSNVLHFHHELDNSHNVTFSTTIAVLSLTASIFICCGNLMTLLAISTSDRLQTIPNMYIVSVAVADCLVGLMLFIQGLSGLKLNEDFDENNEYVCLPLMSLLFIAVTASMFSALLVALDRYIFIIHPLRYPTLVTKQRYLFVMTMTWILAFIYGSVPMYTSHFQSLVGCTPTHIFSKTYMIIVHPTVFFTICITTSCVYGHIVRTACHQHKQIKAQNDQMDKISRSEKRVSRQTWRLVKLFMAVFGFFFISWCPLLIASILEYTVHVNHEALTLCSLVAIMNSGTNVLVLCAMNKDLRSAYRKLGQRLCRRHKVHPEQTIPAVSSSNVQSRIYND